MDELSGQIRELLGDPKQMAQIMDLAQSLMGGAAAPPAGEEAAPPPVPPRPADSGGERQALLRALEPYLSEKRRRKLERAMRITRRAQLAKLAHGEMGGAGDA